MSTRRPRVKVAANLSIRRPAKAAPSTGGTAADVKPDVQAEGALKLPKTEAIKRESTADEVLGHGKESDDGNNVTKEAALVAASKAEPLSATTTTTTAGDKTSTPTSEQSAFKFPKPVEEPPRITTPAPVSHSPLEIHTEEPHSPKKLDSKFAYINALNSPRKRIRTESMTSNKSYSDVSLKSRKTIKQEVSQKASDAKRDLRKRLNNIQNIDKQSLTMFDMIYYNPVKNPMKSPAISKKGSMENIPHTVDRESRSVSKSRSPTPAPARMPPPPAETPKPTVQLTPQLKLGPNGEMILDETSLVVENEREREMRDTLAKTEVIYVDEFSGNSGYYSRYKRTRDWPPEETIRFYRCLHTIGTDFSMMMQLFPNRSRRDLKLKFKKEERLNLKLVNKALLYHKEFNIEELKQQFQEEDEQIERQREQERQMKAEAEQKLQQQKLAKKMQLHQNKNRNPKKRVSKSARVMLDGERLMKTEPLLKESKPKRRRRKNAKEQDSVEKKPEPHQSAPEDDDVFDDANVPSPMMVESDHEQAEHVPASDVAQSAPYVPNVEVAEVMQAASNDEQPTLAIASPALPDQPSPAELSEAPLDIEAMDISIVDEESRSLYEIKAERKAQPVQHFQNDLGSESDTPNVITIQDLDDQSQTTVVYQEPTTVMASVDQSIELDSIESKYYGACQTVYIPMPVNAPIAHPVKTETIRRVPQVVTQPTVETPIVQYVVESIEEDKKPVLVEYQPTVESADQPTESVDEIEPEHSDFPEPTPLVDSKQELQLALVEKKEEIVEPEPPKPPAEEPVAEEEDEPRGLGPLEDIDINSLVLVESQDATNPNKTIYEIYVSNPETGKLSEKPLDVPEDVIENIRSILEVGED